jgi:hypothetical protein
VILSHAEGYAAFFIPSTHDPQLSTIAQIGGTMILAEHRLSLTKRLQGRGVKPAAAPVPRPTMLAVEMLLHEELERHALAGELKLLRARWREAEEIASIADSILTDEHSGGPARS